MKGQPLPSPIRNGTSLSESRTLRTVLLCLLYFAQGFPWGFATIALLAALSEAGHPKAETATITAMAILPWTFKFFWAPMIDTIRFPALGMRRPWIIVAQIGMTATLFGAWSFGELEQPETLTYLAWVFFVHNCFASLQDVSTDALAVDLLDDNERGRVNGLMWGSKLLGKGVGGAGMGTLIVTYGMNAAVLTQAIGVFAILCAVVILRERAGEKLLPWTRGSSQAATATPLISNPLVVLKELLRALSTRTTALVLLLAALMQMCDGLFAPLTTELFVQGLGWTAEEYSKAQGLWGVSGEVIGALLGGFLCDRLGRRRMAAAGMILVSVSLFAFGLTAEHWHSKNYPAWLLLPIFNGAMAWATVCFFSLSMKIAWTNAAATQFTLYMAMSNVGYALGARTNKANEWLGAVGWSPLDDSGFYVLAGCMALTPLLVLPSLKPDAVVALRNAEQSQRNNES